MKNPLPLCDFYAPSAASIEALNADGLDLMTRRTAGTHAAFALPLLRPGMRLLDCGCGPGSITLGLAERVRPGGVIGVDYNGSLLDQANQAATERGLNAAFLKGNVYELPFGAAEFDGVFSHALFEHLSRPTSALMELRRVMKPGAFIALRSPDWGGFVLDPWDGDVSAAINAYRDLLVENGSDVLAGRKLGAWLRATGFHHVTPSASYEIYPSTRLIADFIATQLEQNDQQAGAFILREWAAQPGALFAQSWFEAVGWKPWM